MIAETRRDAALGAEGSGALASSVVAAFQRDDFYSFFVRCFEQLHGGKAYTPAWHAEAVAARLAGVREGRARRLIVNVPPRHMKSVAASVALPAWLLGHDPSLAIVNVSYAQHLSDKFARDCRAVMSSGWYQALFQTRLASAREPLAELSTAAGGSRLATSIGGVITGLGADVIVIDDPLQPDDAMSENRRRAVNDWFDGTLYPRLNDKAKGAIVIIMQRLHEDDLVGHVLEKGRWEVLRLPAIAEEDEVHVVETRHRRDVFSRRAGEALQPGRESLSTLEGIRLTTGEFRFAAQYQQRPAPAGGGLIKADWFARFRPAEAPPFDRILQSWDTANKATELADYSVCTTWGLKGPNFYLLNVMRKKLAFPDLRRAVKEQERLYRPEAILIEDKASGTQLIQDLIHEGLLRVTGIRPDRDKIMRAHAQTAVIENGFVHLPDKAHWLSDYLAELTVFPGGRYDDQVEFDHSGARVGEAEAGEKAGHHRLLGDGGGESHAAAGDNGPDARPAGLGRRPARLRSRGSRRQSLSAEGRNRRSRRMGREVPAALGL